MGIAKTSTNVYNEINWYMVWRINKLKKILPYNNKYANFRKNTYWKNNYT